MLYVIIIITEIVHEVHKCTVNKTKVLFVILLEIVIRFWEFLLTSMASYLPNLYSLLKNSNIQEKRRSMLGDYTVYAILGFSVFCLITVG